jgi:hypothetical protein
MMLGQSSFHKDEALRTAQVGRKREDLHKITRQSLNN